MKLIIKLMLVTLSMCATSCSNNSDAKNTIYTSFYPVYEFTKRIVGDKYKVENLTPAGVEPHDFEISARQVANLYDCKALFINGLNLEHWYGSISNKINNKTCIVTKDIPTRTENDIVDPHVWLNPIYAISEMENIASYMIAIDPENKTYYEDNFNIAAREFAELDVENTVKVASFANKNILVNHAAFGYLCDRYGLNQIAVSGLEPEQEPGPQTITEIMEKVEQYNITTIFTEELASSEVSESIARQCNIKTDVLNPLEGLTKEQIDNGENYITVMRDNFIRLERACK